MRGTASETMEFSTPRDPSGRPCLPTHHRRSRLPLTNRTIIRRSTRGGRGPAGAAVRGTGPPRPHVGCAAAGCWHSRQRGGERVQPALPGGGAQRGGGGEGDAGPGGDGPQAVEGVGHPDLAARQGRQPAPDGAYGYAGAGGVVQEQCGGDSGEDGQFAGRGGGGCGGGRGRPCPRPWPWCCGRGRGAAGTAGGARRAGASRGCVRRARSSSTRGNQAPASRGRRSATAVQKVSRCVRGMSAVSAQVVVNRCR